MKSPTVSVIIPSYNRETGLRRAIQSVLVQTFKDIEIIVVDDASIVDTEKVVGDFDDKRIRFIRHEKNKGLAGTKNTGIRMARGQYITFLDDDDEYLKKKIEQQFEILEESPPTVGLVYCGIIYQTDEGRYLGVKRPGKKIWDTADHMERSGPTPLVKKTCFEKVGLFDENFRSFEDWDMWFRMSHHYEFRWCTEPLYIVHTGSPGQLTNNIEMMMKYLEMLYEKHAQSLATLPKKTRKTMYSKYHKSKAVRLFQSGKTRNGSKEAIKAIILNPLKVELWKIFISGIFGVKIYYLLNSRQRIRKGPVIE